MVVMVSTSSFANNNKPNVVLMLADNLGYGDLSIYNGGIRGGMQPPNIDQLAKEGIQLMSETTSFPQIYNIEAAPKERVDIAIEGFAWTLGPYLKLISNYKASLKEHPNRPGANFTKF